MILVKKGMPNPCPQLDQCLKESLAGKYNGWDHVKAKKKWVMAGNVYYERGDVEKALFYWKKALETTYPDSDYRAEALFGLALLYEQTHDYGKALYYYRNLGEYMENEVKRAGDFRSSVLWMRCSAQDGVKRATSFLRKAGENG
jgi:tetratricopeptide (TPR) repeat protein